LGLQHRTDLCSGCGMLFDFQTPQPARFWMKNTPTSLDIIFIRENGEIDQIHHNTKPFQENPTYNSKSEIRYVLEMKAGFAKKHNLKIGSRLDMDKIFKIIQKTSSN
jgi:uncharacterized protein